MTDTSDFRDSKSGLSAINYMDLSSNSVENKSNFFDEEVCIEEINTENENQTQPTRITYKCFKKSKQVNSYEIVVVREKWNSEKHISRTFSEMQTVNINNDSYIQQGSSNNFSRANKVSANDSNISSQNDVLSVPKCNDDNKNLSWLLDFKVESLFRGIDEIHFNYDDEKKCRKSFSTGKENKSDRNSPVSSSRKYLQEQGEPEDSRREHEYESKPPYTYTELIAKALEENGQLTVSEIYQWITDHYPYYKSTDDRWKNSVRHNLSINPYFRKGEKAIHGTGHLWTTAMKLDQPKQKRQRTITTDEEGTISFDEVRAATASIEDKENRAVYNEVLLSVAALDASKDNLDYSDECSDIRLLSLEQSAEQILSGVKRNVEVQYITPINDDASSMETSHGEQRKPLVEIQNYFPSSTDPTVFPTPAQDVFPYSYSSTYYDPYPPVIKPNNEDFLNCIGNEVEISADTSTLNNLDTSSSSLDVMEQATIFSDDLISFPFYEFSSSIHLSSEI